MGKCQEVANVCVEPEAPDCCLDAGAYAGFLYVQVPRLIITDKTREIIVDIGRSSFDAALDTDPDAYTLEIQRRRCGVKDEDKVVLTSYSTVGSAAHFVLSGEFITDPEKFKRGFYDAVLKRGECVIGDLEIIKAPSTNIINAHEVHKQECFNADDSEWVEPPCVDEPGSCTEDKCESGRLFIRGDCCIAGCEDDCGECNREVIVSRHNILDGYVDHGGDDVISSAPSIDENLEIPTMETTHTTRKKPVIQKGLLA